MSKRKGFYVEGGLESREEMRVLKTAKSKAERKRHRLKRMLSTIFWKHYLEDFQLYRGDYPYPKTMVMTGEEAAIDNRRKRISFAKRVDDAPETRLWEWKLTDLGGYKEVQLGFVDRHLGRPGLDISSDKCLITEIEGFNLENHGRKNNEEG